MKIKLILSITAALIALSAAGCGSNNEKSAQEEKAQPTAVPVRTLTLTAAGDCTFATDDYADPDLGFNAYANEYGTDYFLKNVKDIFSDDDITLVNFEGALSKNGTRANKQFAFRGDPSYVNVLTSSSVEAANLANNHSGDYGETALNDTRDILEENGIITCRGKYNVTVGDVNGIRTGFVGINYLNDEMKKELEDAINVAKNADAELIILSMHWGIEKENYPNDEQIEAAHRAIDCGADVVIGTHPHVLQGVEKYNGKYICYSLGNFCFGGNNSPSDKDAMMFRQTFTFDENGLRDDDNISIIPCRISGHDGYNDYQPKVAQGEQRDKIISRINEYNKQFGTDNLKFYE